MFDATIINNNGNLSGKCHTCGAHCHEVMSSHVVVAIEFFKNAKIIYLRCPSQQ